MTLLRLADIPEGHSEREWTTTADALEISDSNLEVPQPVSLEAALRRDGERIRIRLGVKGDVVGGCCRCLADVRIPVVAEGQVLFDERTDRAETNNLWRAQEEAIELAEEARELFILELPVQVLCQDDCLGLCSRCGENRNRAGCKCDGSDVDPRWSALGDLAKEKDANASN